MTKTFKHSGDLGDIIFALPAVRALGGGILYLDPDGGTTSPLVSTTSGDPARTKLNAAAIDALRPLLLEQPYIQEVRSWKGQSVDYDLDQFRTHLALDNISDSHLAPFGLPFTERDKAWLSVAKPIVIENRPIVISRTARYQSNHLFWEHNLPQLLPLAVFVGYPKEHEIFEYAFGLHVEYYPTPDLMTLASVIAGCELFVGNSSLPHALAEAMKKPLVNEFFRVLPRTMFKREDAHYV